MPIQDIMTTSNPIYDYAFSWTIDNFWMTSWKLQGPPFNPIPGYSSKFCFELTIRDVYEKSDLSPDAEKSNSKIFGKTRNAYLDVKLRCLNDNVPNLHVCASYIKLRDPNNKDKRFDIHGSRVAKVVQTTPLAIHSRKNLCDDVCAVQYLVGTSSKLIMEGNLRFSGYNVTSSIYTLPMQQPLENCQGITMDLKTIYDSSLGSDFTFFVGEEKLRAHKTILLYRSPVFAKMFEHDVLENNTNNVTIKDFDSHTFNCFLVYLYTNVMQDGKYDTVISLYSVAQKYQVKSLQKTCSELLVKQLSVETVCSVLVLADLHNDEELKNNVKIFIRQNFFDIVGSPMWFEFVTNNPQLAQDVLSCMKSLHN